MKVRLTKDLIGYGETLVKGAEGIGRITKMEVNDWGQEMIEVKIPGSEALPLGWNVLEIIDKKFWKDREIAIKRATSIIMKVGPRGGYKGMKITWMDNKGNERIEWCNNKLETERCLEIAKGYNIRVYKEVV